MRLLTPFSLLLLAGCNGCQTKDGEPIETGPIDSGDTAETGDTGETGELPFVDEDGDTYPAGDGPTEDCDDTNPDTHPGAEETCDEIDNDCDGSVDNNAVDATVWHEDADRDGYGDGTATAVSCDAPAGAVADGSDCDDTDPDYNPGEIEDDCNDPNDYNCDGSVGYLDADGDGWAACMDCNDSDGAVNPDAIEVCDVADTDEDCDGLVNADDDSLDPSSQVLGYADADGDGFGDAADPGALYCELPGGVLADNTDCDDAALAVNPGATEVCNGTDDDCDAAVDDGDASLDISTTTDWYADADADSFGAGTATAACEAPAGTVADDTDCDDADAAYHPGAPEDDCSDPADYNCDGSVGFVDADGDTFAACEDCDDNASAVSPAAAEVCNGYDDDCDGMVDLEAVDPTTWYTDEDADGFGGTSTLEACDMPSGYADNADDCDDASGEVNPAAAEVCNEIDDDCDTNVDEGVMDTFYADVDGDGFGDGLATEAGCVASDSYVTDASDCDDTATAVNPAATEVCNDLDDDCDGTIDLDATDQTTWYTDADSDGYGADSVTGCDQPDDTVTTDGDCDDTAPAVNPAATEVCNDTDDDCDGTIDVDASDAGTWYTDADSDGYGSDPVTGCDQPDDAATTDGDCDDAAPGVNPAATEVCNDLDDDCDGTVDLDATDETTWYADSDSDGYGDATITEQACDQPGDFTDDATDCNDSDSSVNPGAVETWYDGIDQDCDGAPEYDADGDGDPSDAYGGEDCEDTDPERYGGYNCRAECTHPDAATLTSYDPGGVSDIVFDNACTAWVTTLISGTDYVYSIDSTGVNTVLTGESNHDIGALALDPLTGTVAVSYNNVGYLGVQSGGSIPVVATGGAATGANWTNGYVNGSASSIAWDSNGCIWVPNWDTSGTVDCLTAAGAFTTVETFGTYVESVALDPDEVLYVSVGATIWEIDPADGEPLERYTFEAVVLDMVFDYQGDLYVETAGNEIRVLDAAATVDALFVSVTGEGKLAISPDGYLVRASVDPVNPATYEEWGLGG